MTVRNAPPTPPLSENDARQSVARQSAQTNASSSLRDAVPTVYSDTFPTISNLAIQNRLSELIDLVETTELTANVQSRVDQSRLLLVSPLVLSYIIINDLPPAHIALNRLPESLASHALTRSLLKLVAAAQYRNYRLIYKTSDELLDQVQGNFFNASLATVIKLLIERHIQNLHRKTITLLSKAYSSLPVALVATYFNVAGDDARRSLENIGWTFDAAKNQLFPPPAKLTASARSASSLSTVRQMIGGTAHVESSV